MAAYNFIVFIFLILIAGGLYYVLDTPVNELYDSGENTPTRDNIKMMWDYSPAIVLLVGGLYLWNATQKGGPY